MIHSVFSSGSGASSRDASTTMSAPSTQARQSSVGDDRLAEIARKPRGEGVAAFRPARMDADLVEVEEMVEQADVPIGRAARADMAEHLGVLARQIFGAERGHRAGAHVGDAVASRIACGMPVRGSKRLRRRQLRRQAELVVVDEVADDLDAGAVERRDDRAAQHVEMAVDDRPGTRWTRGSITVSPLPCAARLASIAARISVVGERQRLDVEAIEKGHVDRRHRHPFSRLQAPVSGVTEYMRALATSLVDVIVPAC